MRGVHCANKSLWVCDTQIACTSYLFRGVSTTDRQWDSGIPVSRGEVMALTAILVLAFVLRMAIPIYLPNIYHPDEVFQYLEQGHRLAFHYGVVPWEYRTGIRSWALPGFLGALMLVTSWFGGGAAAYLLVIAAALSLLSLVVVVVSWWWTRALAGPTAAPYGSGDHRDLVRALSISAQSPWPTSSRHLRVILRRLFRSAARPKRSLAVGCRCGTPAGAHLRPATTFDTGNCRSRYCRYLPVSYRAFGCLCPLRWLL